MSLVAFRRDWANFWRCVRDLWEEAAQPEYRAALVAQSLVNRPQKHSPLASAFASEDGANGAVLRFNDLALDTRTRDVSRRERPMELTPTEFRLLEALVRAAGDIVPHHLLARAGWPAETDPDLLWLKPHLARLLHERAALLLGPVAGGQTVRRRPARRTLREQVRRGEPRQGERKQDSQASPPQSLL